MINRTTSDNEGFTKSIPYVEHHPTLVILTNGFGEVKTIDSRTEPKKIPNYTDHIHSFIHSSLTLITRELTCHQCSILYIFVFSVFYIYLSEFHLFDKTMT
jgi:hypothetical protein